MPKFFITGANGWLGSNLIQYIFSGKISAAVTPQNINVLCQENEDTSALSSLGITIHKGDVCDLKSIKSFLTNAEGATVIHLAGLIHPRLKISDFFDVNYLGTKNIIEISQRVGVKKIVLMSSNSPIGCNKSNKDEDIFTEDSPFNPYVKYGESKFLAEKFAQNFIAHNQSPKISIIRAPWFYGPNQPARQTLFFTMIKDGKFPIVGSGENKRSMAYTENLSQGIFRAALSEKADGEIYWIADEKPYTMNKIICTVREVLQNDFGIKCKNSVIKIPSFVSECAYLADKTLQGLGLYHQKIHVLSEMNKNIFCSIKKAERDLEYKPEFDLRSGMKKSIEWCLNNNIKI